MAQLDHRHIQAIWMAMMPSDDGYAEGREERSVVTIQGPVPLDGHAPAGLAMTMVGTVRVTATPPYSHLLCLNHR
ncbi:hypothetical protein [Inquilinus sp. CA228]|uniref:hypothetical protein n=1 Tax=Inquilinus sp. CA228 TaxID=3455609 RepID=UPI003F8D4B2E